VTMLQMPENAIRGVRRLTARHQGRLIPRLHNTKIVNNDNATWPLTIFNTLNTVTLRGSDWCKRIQARLHVVRVALNLTARTATSHKANLRRNSRVSESPNSFCNSPLQLLSTVTKSPATVLMSPCYT